MNKILLIELHYLIFFLSSCSYSTSTDSLPGDQIIAVENGYVPSGKAGRLGVRDYIQWVQDSKNGFRKEKTINNLRFSVQFKPFEYIVCLEEKKSELADSIVRRKVSELNDMQYYDLKIALTKSSGEILKHELTSTQQYQERVNYYAFGMQNDIQLLDGTDTLPCVLFHFERSFDASPESTFLLGFPINRREVSGDKTLIIYDRIFSTGLIKFTFSKKELKNLPKLKTI